MKTILLFACISGFLALTASASAVPEQESALDAAFDDQVKSTAREAIFVGEILSDVASQLAEDEDLKVETDEYFIRAAWEKTKSAVKNATAKVKAATKNAYNEAKEHFKNVAKEAKAKANEKILEIMAKIFGKFMGAYALDDSEARVEFVKAVAADMERVSQRLRKHGISLLES